ncbi:MAG: flagellar assembly protein FliW [Epsilonproteobacteria bacterium]|nr:MAG: flagellar assembly protein FliW [Campylobacterota bacterium]RLA67526.1 MAG: flagellar assembly protein FliW [Campylobacterota bacterium]
MQVTTTRFGELEVKKEDIFHIKEGLMGFESLSDFFIVDPGDQTLILWLQSTKDPAIAFPVIEPKIFNPDYQLKLLPQEMQSLELTDLSDATVFCILTIPKQVSEMSANLKAPLIINSKTKNGRQIVLQDSKLDIRCKIYNDLKKFIVNYTSDDAPVEKKEGPSIISKRP